MAEKTRRRRRLLLMVILLTRLQRMAKMDGRQIQLLVMLPRVMPRRVMP
jgi:hypothetical protein